MEIEDITLKISYFRNKYKISARELSLTIDKHGGYINKLESKNFNLPVAMLLKIIEALNISCNEFFADNYMTYDKDIELKNAFEKLSADNKQMILNLIKNFK